MSGYVETMTSADQRLFQACSLHRPKAVAEALALGARAQTLDADGESALHAMACELAKPNCSGDQDERQNVKDCKEVAMLLVEAGLDIECRCQRGLTALEAAAETGKIQAAKVLLTMGAHMGLALHKAAARTNLVEMVRELLGAGADPLRLDTHGLTALDHARGSWGGVSPEMVAVLEAAEMSAMAPPGIKASSPCI